MRIYLCGPINGNGDHVREALNLAELDKWAKELREVGHTVINPAEVDRVLSIDKDSIQFLYGGHGKECYRDILIRDLGILAICDVLAYLEGWSESKGCKVEVAFAEALGIPCIAVEGLVDL